MNITSAVFELLYIYIPMKGDFQSHLASKKIKYITCCQLFSSFFVDRDRLTRRVMYGPLGIKNMADMTSTESRALTIRPLTENEILICLEK